MIDYLMSLSKRFQAHTWHETTIDELSRIFSCSTRYAKTILKKFREEGWIDWQSFKGRGKKPLIYLQVDEKEVIHIKFDLYWRSSKFKQAYQLLHEQNLLQNDDALSWIRACYGVVSIGDVEEERDVFRYPYSHVELKLDPLRGLSRHDSHFCEQLFEPLFDYCPVTQTVQPNVAFAYETKDAKYWLIYLRKGVFFHDQTELTSKDVVATLERAKREINEFVGIECMTILNDTCLEIVTTEPDYLLPRYLSGNKLAIVSHKWIENGEEGIPVGCGPFQLMEQNKDSMRLGAFQNYFGHRAWIDEIEIIHTPDSVDFGLSKQPLIESMERKLEQVEPGADFILLNAGEHSRLHDPVLRQLLYDAISPEPFCLLAEGEIVAHSFLLGTNEEPTSYIDAIPDFTPFPKLRIGIQQIRQHANHLREAGILSKHLTELHIEHEMELVEIGLGREEVAMNYDMFVGGMALGNDLLISLLFALQSNKFYLTEFLPMHVKEDVFSDMKYIKSTPDAKNGLDQYLVIEQKMKDAHVLKLLAHRKHQLYIRNDSPFANFGMDTNGKINYSSVYKKFS